MSGRAPPSVADRIGIVIAALLAAFCACLGAALLAAVGTLQVPRLESAILSWFVYSEIAIALPIWIFLRVLARIWKLFRRPLAKPATGRSSGDRSAGFGLPGKRRQVL